MIALLLAASVWLAPGLKSRTAIPKHYQHLTVKSLLHSKPDAFKVGDAGSLKGYVAGRRHEADGDWHLEIADSPTSNRAHSVVCEIVPVLPQKLPQIRGQVIVKGWIYVDEHHLHEPGRGTLIEIHPVTSIQEVKQ